MCLKADKVDILKASRGKVIPLIASGGLRVLFATERRVGGLRMGKEERQCNEGIYSGEWGGE